MALAVVLGLGCAGETPDPSTGGPASGDTELAADASAISDTTTPGGGAGGSVDSTAGVADADPPGSDGSTSIPAESFQIDSVEPTTVSARGGDVLTLKGIGFPPAVDVYITGIQAKVVAAEPTSIVLRTPPLYGGSGDIEVHAVDEVATLLGALDIVPLSLVWSQIADNALPPSGASTNVAAQPFDVDNDGRMDVVLATDEGLRVLKTTEDDGFAAIEPLAGTLGSLRGLSRLELGGSAAGLALAACTGGGRELLVVAGRSGLKIGAALPWRVGRCEAIATADCDGDGDDDLVVAVSLPGEMTSLRVYRQTDGQFEMDEGIAPASQESNPIGEVLSTDTAAPQGFERRPVRDGGRGFMTYGLTALGPTAEFRLPTNLPVLPTRLSFRVEIDAASIGLRPRVIDAVGRQFDGPISLPPAGEWTLLEYENVGTWSATDADPTPAALPLKAVSLVVLNNAPLPLVGTVQTDDWLAESDTHLPVLISHFDAPDPRYSFASVSAMVAGHADDDGTEDLLVLAADANSAPILMASADASQWPIWKARLAPVGADGPYRAGAAMDANSDGYSDWLITTPTQDRLALADGLGGLVDATNQALPLDWATGGAAVAVDLNRDGFTDLVVGNTDATDRLYLGAADGRFVDATPQLGFDSTFTAALVTMDVDGDGDHEVLSIPENGALVGALRWADDAPLEGP